MVSRALRCLVVWLMTTAPLTGIGWLALDNIRGATSAIGLGTLAGQSFETLFTWLCSAVLVGCCLWLWFTSTVVVLSAARGQARDRVHGCPDFLRRGLLLACGVALASSLTVPVYAATAGISDVPHHSTTPAADSAISGLAIPDRAERNSPPSEPDAPKRLEEQSSTPVHTVVRHESAVRMLTVQAGDSLWEIAADTLGPLPSAAAIAERSEEIYALNHGIVGSDPNRIFPGQELRLPMQEGE